MTLEETTASILEVFNAKRGARITTVGGAIYSALAVESIQLGNRENRLIVLTVSGRVSIGLESIKDVSPDQPPVT